MIVFYGSLASLSSPKFLVDLFLLYGASSVLWTRTERGYGMGASSVL